MADDFLTLEDIEAARLEVLPGLNRYRLEALCDRETRRERTAEQEAEYRRLTDRHRYLVRLFKAVRRGEKITREKLHGPESHPAAAGEDHPATQPADRGVPPAGTQPQGARRVGEAAPGTPAVSEANAGTA